jgi:hypothetical protein
MLMKKKLVETNLEVVSVEWDENPYLWELTPDSMFVLQSWAIHRLG